MVHRNRMRLMATCVLAICVMLPLFHGSGGAQLFGRVGDPRWHIKFSDRDGLFPLTGLEYGEPDGLSFTSMYVHVLSYSDTTESFSSFAASLSPGVRGIRLKAGYWFARPALDLMLLVHVDAVALHAWRAPMSPAVANKTYVGVEARPQILPLYLAVGYYWPIGSRGEGVEPFLGLHVGFGF